MGKKEIVSNSLSDFTKKEFIKVAAEITKKIACCIVDIIVWFVKLLIVYMMSPG